MGPAGDRNMAPALAPRCAPRGPAYSGCVPSIGFPMQLPLLLDRSGRDSLTNQIIDQLRQAIGEGRLPRGARLPSSRRLAEQLEVARNTVIRAYEILAIEGLAESRPASGVFVTGAAEDPRRLPSPPGAPSRQPLWSMPTPPALVPAAPRPLAGRNRLAYDFAPGRAHPALFPLKLWRRLVLAQLAHGGASGLTDEGDPAGLPSLRAAVAAHLAAARGIVADPSRVIITAGVQEGIALAARLFLHRGTTAAIEDPGASAAALTFAATGSEVVGVGVDEEGLLPDDLPQRPTALLYVTPSHQFPTGCVLSAERRDAIASWARRCGCYVLEDDSDGEFRYEGSPLRAVAADAPDCTLYLGTFSRTLGAGLRLGFLLAPPRLVDTMIAAKEIFDGGAPWLEQSALAAMMVGPSYAAHVARVRAHYKENRDCLLAALRRNFGEIGVSGEGSGVHLLWRLPPGVSDAASVEALARAAPDRRLYPRFRRRDGAHAVAARAAGARARIRGAPAQADRAGRRPPVRDHRRHDRRPVDGRHPVPGPRPRRANARAPTAGADACPSGLPFPPASGSTGSLPRPCISLASAGEGSGPDNGAGDKHLSISGEGTEP